MDYFEVVSSIALVIGLIVVNVWAPGVGMNVDVSTLDTKGIAKFAEPGKMQTTAEFLMNIIPTSVVDAFAKGDMLQVLFFSILFGYAMHSFGERGKPVFDLIEKLSHVLFGIVGVIMKVAPIGAFGAMAYTIGKHGVGSLTQLASLMGAFYLTCLIFIFGVLGSIAKFHGFSIVKLIKYIKEELFLVLGTSSSESALPRLMAKMENAGAQKSVVGLVVPTGYSFNLDGTSIYLTMAAVFIAQATNTPMDLGQQITLLVILLLTSKGAAGVTGKAGFPKKFGAGVISTSGALGILIPPSIVMVMYSVATNTSVGALFMAGVVPGIALALTLGGVTWYRARKYDYPRQPKATWGERWTAFRASVWGLLLIVVVMGGIYTGIFTPTEAAAMSAVYAFICAVFIYRDLGLKDVPKVLLNSANMSAMLLYIITNAVLFSFIMTNENIPQALADWMLGHGLGLITFLLAVNVILLLAGNFMEPSSIVLIFAPILFPVAVKLGIHPVHFGILMVVNMEVGMCHPPVGLNLYVASGITKMGITELTVAVWPWLLSMLCFLMLVTYWPSLSLWLPQQLGML